MGHIPYLERHGHGWRFRIRLPKSLVVFKTNRELRITLGSVGHRRATALAVELRARAERLFIVLRQLNDPSAAKAEIARWTRQQIQDLALRALDYGLLVLEPAEREAMRGSSPGCDPGQELDLLLRTAIELDLPNEDARTRRALAGLSPERDEFGPWLTAGLRALGMDRSTDRVTVARVLPAIAEARSEYLKALVAIGNGTPGAIAEALVSPDEERRGPTGPVHRQPTDPRPAALPETAYVEEQNAETASLAPEAIMDLWRRFAQTCVESGAWRSREALASVSTIRAVLKLVPGFDPARLTPAGAEEIRSRFLRLPGNYGHPPFAAVWDEEGYDGIIRLYDRLKADPAVHEQYPPLTAKTWNKHSSRLTAFMRWLGKHKLAPPGAVDAFSETFVKIRKAKVHRQVGLGYRDCWLPENIEKLFRSPVFTGCRSDWYWKEPGAYVYRTDRFWMPLIACLHGMRRAEMAQLTVGRIKQEAGVCWYFDLLSPGADLELKAVETSPRLIPIHPTLIALGFMEARVQGRGSDERVFPEAAPGGQTQAWGDAFGKFFGRLTENLSLPAGHDLHAFRTTLVTSMLSLGVPTSHVSEITGHELSERRAAFHDYDRGRLLSELYQALCRWQPPIDVDTILAAVARSEALDRSSVWPSLQTKNSSTSRRTAGGRRVRQ